MGDMREREEASERGRKKYLQADTPYLKGTGGLDLVAWWEYNTQGPRK
jgi:hypothetical protein